MDYQKQSERQLKEDFEKRLRQLDVAPFHRASLLVLGLPELKMVAAWPSVYRWIERPVRENRNPWNWIRFDSGGWEILAGVRVREWDLLFARLVALRAILPDGTIPQGIEDYIDLLVRQGVFEVRAAPKRPRAARGRR